MKPNFVIKNLLPFFLILVCILFSFGLNSKSLSEGTSLKIAFGSCLNQNGNQSVWKDIAEQKPDFWIWMGDNIYEDTEDIEKKRNAYAKIKSDPGYLNIKKNLRVIGTWDDHDFGYNDVGAEYAPKKESQNAFLDFMDVPINSPLRNKEGIYDSHNINFKNKNIRIILLDTRYFRSKLRSNWFPYLGFKRYIPSEDADATLLGNKQWEWLEQELKKKSDLFIIVSSIQVLNDVHRWEKWGNFPRERNRLLNLIDSYGKNKTILLSGDRHIAEVFREKLTSGFSITDITSSSMNKPLPIRKTDEEDDRRISEIYDKSNFGILKIENNNGLLKVIYEIRGIGEEGKVLSSEIDFK